MKSKSNFLTSNQEQDSLSQQPKHSDPIKKSPYKKPLKVVVELSATLTARPGEANAAAVPVASGAPLQSLVA